MKEFYTPAHYDLNQYRLRTTTQTSAAFELKACRDGHVVLMDRVGDDVAYELTIGSSGNDWCVIRKQRQTTDVAGAYTPDILNCDQMLPFWVSWVDGLIQLGRGSMIGDDLIVSWQDAEPLAVSHVSISTYSTSEGYWQFTNYPGICVYI